MKPVITWLCLAAAAEAQGVRDGDRQMDRDALLGMLSGHSVEFFDGSIARYAPGGGYSYSYQTGDAPFVGRYEAGEDSRVCVTFENGFGRCDTFVMAGDRLVLITADGLRFPARAVARQPA